MRVHPFFRARRIRNLTPANDRVIGEGAAVLHVRTWATPILAAALLACAARPEAPVPPPAPPGPEPAEEPARDDRTVIGAILPQSADATLRQYGELVREGVDIALADDTTNVELVVVDDGGDETRAASLIAELESRGAVAILGPLLGEAVDAAAAARSDPDLAIISPTSSDPPQGENVYTLNAEDTRGAEALARHAVASGLTDVAILYPRDAGFVEQVRQFRTAVRDAGGRIVDEVSWAPGTTTFADQLERLRLSGARAVFVPSSDRDILQLAPQFAYYGLSAIQILGSEAWASEEVLNHLPAGQLEGVIAAVPFLQASDAVAWDEFVGKYEAAERRTLDSPYPALGYDAARLVLEAIGDERRPDAGDVAQRLAEAQDHRGATGVLSLTGGAVTRRPFLVRIQDGRPQQIPDIER